MRGGELVFPRNKLSNYKKYTTADIQYQQFSPQITHIHTHTHVTLSDLSTVYTLLDIYNNNSQRKGDHYFK